MRIFHVSQALFPRLVNCINNAEQLADAQQRRLTILNLPLKTALGPVKRIFLNARSVQILCDLFTSTVVTAGIIFGKIFPNLTSDEHSRFTQALYNVLPQDKEKVDISSPRRVREKRTVSAIYGSGKLLYPQN